MELKKDHTSKIIVKSLELTISSHCNLSCRGCSHLSPLEDPSFIDINQAIKTLRILSKHLHCDVIRLMGGEPTLNNNLEEIVERIKGVGISDKISIPTNGIFLNKISKSIIKNIDIIEISNYNYPKKKTEQIYIWCQNAKKENKDLEIYLYMYEYFREPCAFNKFEDKKVTEQIYKTCIMAHKWQCFNVYKDYIFRCPEAIAISKNIKDENSNENGLKVTGGVKFKQQLENYLFAKSPLSACKYCLGSCGQLTPIKQVTREEQILNLNEPIKTKLDETALKNALRGDVQDMETIKEIIKF